MSPITMADFPGWPQTCRVTDFARYPGLGLPRLLPTLPCSPAEAVARDVVAQHCPDRTHGDPVQLQVPWEPPSWQHPGTALPKSLLHPCLAALLWCDLSHHSSTSPEIIPCTCLNPSQQLGSTQPLIPSHLWGWERGWEGLKWENSRVEIKRV